MKLFKKKEPKEQEAVLTIYTIHKDIDDIYQDVTKTFSDCSINKTTTSPDTYEITLKDNSKIQLSMIYDPSEINIQTNGMANFFARSPLDNEAVKENALRQILLFNTIIGVTFNITNNNNRTNYIIHSIYSLAQHLHGFILHPNMSLYQSDGKLLISIDGKTDLEQFFPIADSSVLDRDITETQADIDRKKRSIEKCKSLGLQYIDHLKLSIYESECKIPSTEEIIHRLSCIFAAAVCAEACSNDDAKKASELVKNMLEDLNQRYQISQWLSDEEREYTSHPLDLSELHPKFGWRYECCAVLLWSLGMWELGEPCEICDASEVGKILWQNDFDSLLKNATPKKQTEILDMQDLIFRYDWACVEARVHKQQIDVIDSDIVYEWHYALNWLTSAYGITNWDEVQPNT